MNQNFFLKKIEDQDLPPLITASQIELVINVNNVASTATTDLPINEEKMTVLKKKKRKKEKYPGFPCAVCKKVFKDKSDMKSHVLETHLRPVILCSDCGKRVFQDKLLQHQTISCSDL